MPLDIITRRTRFFCLLFRLCASGAYKPQTALREDRVFDQLKYRLQREVYGSERPALRRILEHDSPSHTPFVACICSIGILCSKADLQNMAADLPHSRHYSMKNNDDSSVIAIPTLICDRAKKLALGRPLILEISDGWYSAWARIDDGLSNLVLTGKLKSGYKIKCTSAQLTGEAATTPASPLDYDTDSVTITFELEFNSVFPAKWDQKLGFSKVGVSFF